MERYGFYSTAVVDSQLRTRKETNGQRTRVFSKRNGS